ncbi:MAG: hypothetical protein UT34_C0002G0016 [candidate division WS6 bacterium GW2011_GWF2_39_15]|uniref:Glycosyltransferase 2-like domain-containing protein n=1 Tax=candidate division WS6 bacterium GW2011_GWF2_39_15 TaxID=1619100 RepID=A0A0G0MN47_9BACT|nr:MAG: hypothetical protein UT34_C0002G0016 [candidate division WS6 bacterium GW2011_GWF2_39_15]
MDVGTPQETLNPEDVKLKDRFNGYPLNVPRWYTKIFEAIPGLVTWFFLLLPFVVGLTGYPEILVIYIAFLTVYWALRGLKFVVAITLGYMRMGREMKIDWIERMKKEQLPYKEVKYVFICPVVKEGLEVLEPSIKAWSKQDVGAQKLSLVFALEGKYKEESSETIAILEEKYGKYFREVVKYYHPADIEGEVAGVKNPNINWAGRHFSLRVRKREERLDEYLLITCDNDLRPHPKYLSAITYKYLTDINPLRKFYATGIHTFNNNLYRVPTLIRTFSNFLTLAVLNQWVFHKKINETWSSYVANLQTVEDVGYWDPQIPNDDTAFYYNALIRFNGDFAGEEVYIPTYNDAVENDTYVKTHKSLYKQQLRWGWGGIVFPMTFAGMYKNKNIPLSKRIKITMAMFDDRLIFRTVVYLLTLGLPILTLVSPEFQYSSASYNLPKIMSLILTSVMFFNIPIYIIRLKLSPLPKEWGLFRKFLDMVETLLVTVNMLTFAFIPFVQAQTEMMIGKTIKKNHYATEKVSIKK